MKTYSTQQVAELVGIPRRTVQYWIRTKRLAAEHKLGRGRGKLLVPIAEAKRLLALLKKHGRAGLSKALLPMLLAVLLAPASLALAQTFDAAEQRFDAVDEALRALDARLGKLEDDDGTLPPVEPPPVEPPAPPVPVPAAGVEVRADGNFYMDGKRWYMDGMNSTAPWGATHLPEYGTTPHRELKFRLIRKNAALGSVAARIVLYADNRFPGDTAAWRDRVVKEAIASGQLPIVGMWDNTCSRGGAAAVSAVETYWLSGGGARLARDNPTMVVNFFNEMNFDPAAGRHERWRDYYIGLVQRLRAAGINNAVMIDAGGQCAQNPEGIVKYGEAMQAADPQHRLIFAIHMYAFYVDGAPQSWPEGQWNIATTMARLGALKVPVVAAEFGMPSNQDGSNYDVKAMLGHVKAQGVDGALAWMDYDNMPSKPFYSMWVTLLGNANTPFGQIMKEWFSQR